MHPIAVYAYNRIRTIHHVANRTQAGTNNERLRAEIYFSRLSPVPVNKLLAKATDGYIPSI